MANEDGGKNMGGTGSSQHNDWGHSKVPTSDDDVQQGLVPAEEAGELESGIGGIGNFSTGNAGNRQSDMDAPKTRK